MTAGTVTVTAAVLVRAVGSLTVYVNTAWPVKSAVGVKARALAVKLVRPAGVDPTALTVSASWSTSISLGSGLKLRSAASSAMAAASGPATGASGSGVITIQKV